MLVGLAILNENTDNYMFTVNTTCARTFSAISMPQIRLNSTIDWVCLVPVDKASKRKGQKQKIGEINLSSISKRVSQGHKEHFTNTTTRIKCYKQKQ